MVALFKKLNKEGTTIIQVTHSEANAEYGNRIINLGRWLGGEGGCVAATKKPVLPEWNEIYAWYWIAG
jgi:excinuclease UvrABC ATPase subunit